MAKIRATWVALLLAAIFLAPTAQAASQSQSQSQVTRQTVGEG